MRRTEHMCVRIVDRLLVGLFKKVLNSGLCSAQLASPVAAGGRPDDLTNRTFGGVIYVYVIITCILY